MYMKRIFVLSFVFLAGRLFAQDLTALERRIIMAGPEEMLDIIQDSRLESELNSIYNHIEALIDSEADEDDVIAVFSSSFPGTTREECMAMIFKLLLTASFGSGDEEAIEMGMEALYMFRYFEFYIDEMDLDEEDKAFVESSYWKDCMAFSKLFDAKAFIEERYPDYLDYLDYYFDD